jgi:hypothetical protein
MESFKMIEIINLLPFILLGALGFLMVKRISDTSSKMKYVNLKMDEIVKGIDVLGRYNKKLREDNLRLASALEKLTSNK